MGKVSSDSIPEEKNEEIASPLSRWISINKSNINIIADISST